MTLQKQHKPSKSLTHLHKKMGYESVRNIKIINV